MFEINKVNDFITSDCLTHGRCPKNGLRVYFSKDIIAKRIANEFGAAVLNEIEIHQNRQGTICYAELSK